MYHFWIFDTTRPWLKPRPPIPLSNTLTILPMGRYIYIYILSSGDRRFRCITTQDGLTRRTLQAQSKPAQLYTRLSILLLSHLGHLRQLGNYYAFCISFHLFIFCAISSCRLFLLLFLIFMIIFCFESFSHHRLLMAFHLSLRDNKSPQVSRTLLSILADLNNAVIWRVSTRPLISMSSYPCTNYLGTIPSAPITSDITITLYIYIYIYIGMNKNAHPIKRCKNC